MNKTAAQKLAGMRRAELIGYRLARDIKSDEVFDWAVDGDTLHEMECAEEMYKKLESLDYKNAGAVREFLTLHFQHEVIDLDDEQMETCAKAFALQISPAEVPTQQG